MLPTGQIARSVYVMRVPFCCYSPWHCVSVVAVDTYTAVLFRMELHCARPCITMHGCCGAPNTCVSGLVGRWACAFYLYMMVGQKKKKKKKKTEKEEREEKKKKREKIKKEEKEIRKQVRDRKPEREKKKKKKKEKRKKGGKK